ncbi:MAG: formate dehydrogenase-N subunit alpha, partial [Spirochaetota bacterium]|nr:formate dehydrogenase-N subunit alpha [Spirochaetota bacterium]
MWINRREFLKLSGITTAGAFLGGIPLLNGCKSNPDKLKGAKESTTICPFCSVGCGLIVSSRDKKIINIEGDPDHPINRGALCSKGNALYQLTVNKKRLKKVQYRTPYSNKWKDISWEEALKMIAMRIKKTRDDTLVEKEGIYTVNRTNGIVGLGGAALNNEECYVWSKMARILGISYLEHEARNHHSASIASLSNTFGHGAMTNHWIDIQHADVIMIIGSNAAENHPISFKYVTKAMENGGKLISVDPRFTRTSSLSHIFAPLRPGTDITFINGIINYALKNDMIQKEYVVEYTNASFLVNPDFEFNDGLFSGYNTKKKEYTDKSSWKHQLNAKGIPIRDKTLKNSNCVYQLMKKHFSRYTPEEVSAVTGCPINIFIKIAELYTSTHKPDRVATIMYSMGATQHSVGTQNIRSYAILQLLMGNIGLAGGGINALRGESNMQGSTDHSILWDTLPGYLDIPKTKKDHNLKAYNKNNTPKSNDPMSINSWKFKPKYIVSLLKAFYGDAASEENDFCYDWLPKASKLYPHIVLFEDMYAGMHKGAIIMGTNPVVGGPHSNKETKALEKLDWLVAADNWETETAAFWKRPGANPKTIKTEVFLLPAASSIEKEGSISNSGRWAQWRYKAVEPPGEVKDELWIIDRIFKEVRKLYKKDKNAKFSDPILKAYWNFTKEGEDHPDPHLVAKEINGFEWGTKTLIKNLTKLKDDGSTACGNWLYSGSYTEEGNLMARRGMEDAPNELGMYPQWSWCWPANRRIIYNRASVDRDGNPWNKDKPVVKWTGNNWEGDIIDGDGAPDIRNP